MDALTTFGLFAVTAMLLTYALEERSAWFILAFAGACALGSVYGFLQGAWPFGLVEQLQLETLEDRRFLPSFARGYPRVSWIIALSCRSANWRHLPAYRRLLHLPPLPICRNRSQTHLVVLIRDRPLPHLGRCPTYIIKNLNRCFRWQVCVPYEFSELIVISVLSLPIAEPSRW